MRRAEDHIPEIRRFIAIFAPDPCVADTTLNEVLRKAQSGLRSTKSPESLRVFFFREAFKSLAKRKNATGQVGCDLDFEAKLNGAGPAPHARKAYGRFSGLPFAERAVMALMVVERFSVAEAASIMEIDTQTVRQCIIRARRRFNPEFWESFEKPS